ncbi:MAG TPA: DUF1207 domain-containing protein [Gemmatimonadales bacterium]|nr:DUF1207 domain-containing protein [Gemmatimonadales bacterium]
MEARNVVLLLAAAVSLGLADGSAQGGGGSVFRPLLADPKEPQFFASYLWDHSPRLSSKLATVGVGQTIGLVREPNWELAIAAGVFSQFNMQSATNDLINTDYLVGLPFTYRHGSWATRFRLYHQSSHLGDEYLLHTNAQRVDLTFEAAELLVSKEMANWRVYGGGEYLFAHSPADLAPGVLHGGLEYRQPEALVRLGRFAAGRLVVGLDARSVQDRQWQVGWSLVTGLELADPAASSAGWRWSVLLKAYTGPSPYGEFYRDGVASVGLGLGFTL